MPRYKLTIAYDGRPFCGWQRQAGHPSVQQCLELAVERLDGAHALVYGSGRTDTGVHASGQIAHVDLTKAHTADAVQGALNFHLRPHPVSILAVEAVDDSFHARFGATSRHYEYRILNRRGPPAYRQGLVWHVTAPLDADSMHQAAQRLIGHYDFTTFRDSQCQANSPMRTVDNITIRRDGEEIIMSAVARSFLHRQIRSIMGSVVMVGRGKYSPDWITQILEAKDRAKCGPVAPPDGLYLTKILYDLPTSKNVLKEAILPV